MALTSGISVHYYLKNELHLIEAHLRNKREAELLALYKEAAEVFNVELEVYSMPSKEGGYIEIFQFINANQGAIGALTGAGALVVSAIALFLTYSPKSNKLNRQLTQLEIEEKQLVIKKLRSELQTDSEDKTHSQEFLNNAVVVLNENSVAVTRRSNFFKSLAVAQDVEQLGIGEISHDGKLLRDEVTIARSVFPSFISNVNKLPPLIDEEATIELISPVLGEGAYRWKGIYQDKVISFKMADEDFKHTVLGKGVQFYNGVLIKCELIINRKLDEAGEEIVTGCVVTVVLSVGDEKGEEETPQGIEHRRNKAKEGTQGDIFNSYDEWGSF